MSSEEALVEKFRPTIKPTVELREALEEIKKCRDFFEQGELVDYLHSVNRYYLENQGKVTGPEPVIVDDVESDNTDLSEMIELTDSAALQEASALAGIVTSLEWQRTVRSKIIKGRISIRLFYKGDNYNYFRVILYASHGEKDSEESPVLKGKYKQKTFHINPYQNSKMRQDVDNLLLTFTSELLGAKIL